MRKLKNFPILSLLGPRQCGKTTLAKSLFADWKYLDLERPSDFVPLSEDTEARIRQLGEKVILDEAQQLPELFQVLRSYVDERRTKKGQFVLLGSASPQLVKAISESLAGRTAFLELTPFLYSEVFNTDSRYSIEKLWHRGGFPDPFLMVDNLGLLDWFDGYTRTFIERDLAAIGINISSQQMRKLWTMIAHCNGGIWNASQLASSLGVNYQTINRYTDILEQTFLVRKLQPYYANLGKRIVKSPKVYLRDTGLLHYFLGLQTIEQLHTHPARGASWEAFVIEQLIALVKLHLPNAGFYYWRTAGGAEVDLLIETAGRLVPFEIKLHSAPDRKMTRGLQACMKDLNIEKGYVIFPGKEFFSLGASLTVVPVEKLLLDSDFLLALLS